jgi:hypothetical protein
MRVLTATQNFMEKLFVEYDLDEYSSDLLQFIKSETFGVTLICDFSSISEYKEAMLDNPLWELLLDKSDKIKFNTNIENDVFEDTFYQRLDEQNLFLLSLDEVACEQLSEYRGYVYVSSANIGNAWKPIKLIRENSTLKVTKEQSFPEILKFDNWSKLEDRYLPLTSMIIFDKYILCDKSNQKLKDNLYKLLKIFCSNKLAKPLKLTIISEFNSDNQIKSAYDQIIQYFGENDIGNVELNIIRHDKNEYPSDFEGLHSRQILTNNLRIKCEDSFNLFKANGKINNDADITFSFNMSFNSSAFFEKEVKHLKRYIGKLKNKADDCQVSQKMYFYLDKENYLFS